MELRHLRYFIAVAELLSVRAASEQLHVTQPAISRQIQDLEDAIGGPLFERTPRGLRLTPAGNAYLHEARAILAHVDAANRLAHRISLGVAGRMRVGFVENASWSERVLSVLSAFQRDTPDVALELQPMNTPEQLDAIATDKLNGGFVYRFGAWPDGIASVPLFEQTVVLAVPEHCDIGARTAVQAKDLSGIPFIAFPRHVYAAYHDRLISACAAHGLTLDIRQEASTETAILSLVAAGVGAALVNAANRDRPPARVRFVEVADLDLRLPLEFCFRAQHGNAVLERFIDLVQAQQGSPSLMP